MLRSCNNPSCYLISYHTLKFLVENFSARHLHMYIQGGYKEDWATLHAYVFIVIDCIEICRTLFENKKCCTHLDIRFFFVCHALSFFYISIVLFTSFLHLSLSLFLPLFKLIKRTTFNNFNFTDDRFFSLSLVPVLTYTRAGYYILEAD